MSDSTDQTLPPDAARPGKLVVADATAQAESRVVLGFRAQDRRIITVLMSVLLLWLMVEWIVVANRRPDPLLLHRGSEFQGNFRVNVNESTWVEWMQLEGIGPALAQRIVADRSLKGRFSSIKDVGRVPGIGPATLDRIRPWLTMGHDQHETKSAIGNRQRPSKAQPATIQRQPATL